MRRQRYLRDGLVTRIRVFDACACGRFSDAVSVGESSDTPRSLFNSVPSRFVNFIEMDPVKMSMQPHSRKRVCYYYDSKLTGENATLRDPAKNAARTHTRGGRSL